MGDSITAAGWPGMLAGLIGSEVVNRGHNGAVTADGVDDVRAVLAYDRPDYLLVAYGLNDVACRLDPDHILRNLLDIIWEARAQGAQPIIATLTPVFEPYGLLTKDARAVSDRIRTMAASESVRVADVEAAYEADRRLIGADGIHPNREGLQRIAAVFQSVLTELESRP
jgi:lysophospholipase L1-like esterase